MLTVRKRCSRCRSIATRCATLWPGHVLRHAPVTCLLEGNSAGRVRLYGCQIKGHNLRHRDAPCLHLRIRWSLRLLVALNKLSFRRSIGTKAAPGGDFRSRSTRGTFTRGIQAQLAGILLDLLPKCRRFCRTTCLPYRKRPSSP